MLRLLTNFHLRPSSLMVISSRERKRPGTKLRLRMQTQRRKMARAFDKVAEIRKPDFNKRIEQMRNMKSGAKTISQSLAFPSRTLKIFNDATPTDDVYRLSFFDKYYSIADSISMHREIQHPTVYNNPSVPVILRLDLNMNLDGVGEEFVENVSKIISMPHKFDLTIKRTLMLFSKSVESQEAGRLAGAEFVCGEDAIKKVMKGQMKIDDVDYILATADIINHMSQLKGVMKKKFPTTLNGALGLDAVALVEFFRYGVQMDIKRDDLKPEWGICKAYVGKLDMPVEHLEENVDALIKNVCQHRPLAASLGHFIFRAALMVADGREYHQIDFTKYAPPIPETDAALGTEDEGGAKKKKKKKKAKN